MFQPQVMPGGKPLDPWDEKPPMDLNDPWRAGGDPNAAHGNEPAIAIPGAGNPPPPGGAGGGAMGGPPMPHMGMGQPGGGMAPPMGGPMMKPQPMPGAAMGGAMGGGMAQPGGAMGGSMGGGMLRQLLLRKMQGGQ